MTNKQNDSLMKRLFKGTSTKGNGDPKIFCISFQRTGTTSVGRFFHDHGYKVAIWGVAVRNEWNLKWFKGDLENIFSSLDFQNFEVFEDSPWGGNDFYKVLFHRFPDARFVLLERDADKWFNSMMSHSGGRTLGNTHRHSCVYNRQDEYHALKDLSGAYTSEIDNLLLLEESNRDHYKKIYKNTNRETRLFFDKLGKDRLFSGELDDPLIWQKLGAFFSISVNSTYKAHAHASK